MVFLHVRRPQEAADADPGSKPWQAPGGSCRGAAPALAELSQTSCSAGHRIHAGSNAWHCPPPEPPELAAEGPHVCGGQGRGAGGKSRRWRWGSRGDAGGRHLAATCRVPVLLRGSPGCRGPAKLCPGWLPAGPLAGARRLGRQRGAVRPGGFARAAAAAASVLTKHLGSIKLLWSPLHIYQTLTAIVFLAAAAAASLETRGFTSVFPFPNSFSRLFFFFCRSLSVPIWGREGGEPCAGCGPPFPSLASQIAPWCGAGGRLGEPGPAPRPRERRGCQRGVCLCHQDRHQGATAALAGDTAHTETVGPGKSGTLGGVTSPCPAVIAELVPRAGPRRAAGRGHQGARAGAPCLGCARRWCHTPHCCSPRGQPCSRGLCRHRELPGTGLPSLSLRSSGALPEAAPKGSGAAVGCSSTRRPRQPFCTGYTRRQDVPEARSHGQSLGRCQRLRSPCSTGPLGIRHQQPECRPRGTPSPAQCQALSHRRCASCPPGHSHNVPIAC